MLHSLSRAILIGLAACLSLPAVNAQQATTYGYDALGRLISVRQNAGPTSGNVVTYTYDPAGNRTNYLANQSTEVSVGGASANEGAPLIFTVTRSGNLANAATVNYATSNGTAVSGTNYTATSGTLSFSVGVTSQTITVATRSDGVYTSNLAMMVTLSSPSSTATIGNASGTGTIINTDQQLAIVATNPTLPTYLQLTANVVNITDLATLNGRSGRIASFAVPSGGGSAVIAGDGQSLTYTAPLMGSSCELIPAGTFLVNYSIVDQGNGQLASGTATVKAKGTKKPIAQCLQ